jgi:hypothetical protein
MNEPVTAQKGPSRVLQAKLRNYLVGNARVHTILQPTLLAGDEMRGRANERNRSTPSCTAQRSRY